MVRSFRRASEIPWWRDGGHRERDSLGQPRVGEREAVVPEPTGRTRNVARDWRVMTGGIGIQDVAQAGERGDTAESADLATTMSATLSADGLKPHFSSGKDMSTFTAMSFDLNKRTTESVANVAGIDIMTIACKEAGGGGWEGRGVDRGADRSLFIFGRVPGDASNVHK